MSKNQLKNHLINLNKEELTEELLDLYERFTEVKTYYNFIFNPKEDQLTNTAKQKIGKEYFPDGKRRAKKRRSIAQKLIKHFIKLGVNPLKVADVMLFNIEVAQTYTLETKITNDAFCKSMFKSFSEALSYINYHQMHHEFNKRAQMITKQAITQHWHNSYLFENELTKYKN